MLHFYGAGLVSLLCFENQQSSIAKHMGTISNGICWFQLPGYADSTHEMHRLGDNRGT